MMKYKAYNLDFHSKVTPNGYFRHNIVLDGEDYDVGTYGTSNFSNRKTFETERNHGIATFETRVIKVLLEVYGGTKTFEIMNFDIGDVVKFYNCANKPNSYLKDLLTKWFYELEVDEQFTFHLAGVEVYE